VPLLAVPPGERAELLAGIAAAGAGLDVGLDVLRAALLRHLP
jgi:hypothetical protein